MISKERFWFLLRISAVIAGLVILFFSGLFPLEESYLSQVPAADLYASVVAADVASLTNGNRIEGGLPSLSVSPLLTEAAQLKAEDMAKNSYYAHISPDGKSPLYWLNLVGYKYLNAGENLVIDRTTSEQAVDAWMNSPDHRENILRPQFTEIGVGVASGRYQGQDTIYVVEEFGTPYPLSAPVARPAPVVAVKTPAPAAVPAAVSTPPVKAKPQPEQVVASTSPAAYVAPAPAVAGSSVSKTPLAVGVQTAAAPVVKSIEKLALPVPKTTRIATSSDTDTASSTAASSTPVASSSIVYTLAPEFFAPVTLKYGIAAPEQPAVRGMSEDSAEPAWLVSIRAYILRLVGDVPRVWR